MTMKKKKTILTIAVIALVLAACIVLDILLPTYHIAITVIKKASVYALVAVSMNLLNGFTGLFSLGQAGFMLLGAYAYAVLTIPTEKRPIVYQYFDGGALTFSLPEVFGGGAVGEFIGMMVALLIGGILAAIVAYLIGLPVLRLKSDYLAIATLGFAEILRAFFQWNALGPITNGSNLLKSYPAFSHATPYVVLGGLMIAVILLIINSTYGRAFKAIREDEIAAEAMGINLAKHKQLSFCISSFFAGISGALFAMFVNNAQAKPFTTNLTYEILLIVVIGGIGSVSGSCIATFLYVACSEWWLRFLDDSTPFGDVEVPLLRPGFRMVVFSIVIMVVVLFFRRGIMGNKELPDLFKRKRKEGAK